MRFSVTPLPRWLAAALAAVGLLASYPAAALAQLTLVRQSPANGTAVNPGHVFTASWTFKNTSTAPVVISEAVNRTTTTRFAELNHKPLNNVTVAAGKEYTLTIPMRAPEIGGSYTERWRLLGAQGQSVFSAFTLNVVVPGWTPAALPASAFKPGKFLYPIRWRADVNQAPLVNNRFGDWVLDTTDKGHLGEDMAVPVGTPVYAIAPGYVVYARNAGTGWGKVVITAHADPRPTNQSRTIYSLLGHLSTIDVVEGQQITNWTTTVGKSGSEGTGAHTHWELITGTNVRPGPGYSKSLFNADTMTGIPRYESMTWERPSKFVRENLVR